MVAISEGLDNLLKLFMTGPITGDMTFRMGLKLCVAFRRALKSLGFFFCSGLVVAFLFNNVPLFTSVRFVSVNDMLKIPLDFRSVMMEL